MPGENRQRIDKWLWFARLSKTRTLAQRLVASGRVRINRERADGASRLVRVGDVLTVALDSGVRVLRIMTTGSRRGPAAEARLLYEDLAPPDSAAEKTVDERGGGRPTKRDRRAIDALQARDGFSSDDD
jgi:ribosome-associated heat shock protein Hsp15